MQLILEMGERLYQRSRQGASLRAWWGDWRSLMKRRLVEGWQQMLLINLDEEGASPWGSKAQAGAKAKRSGENH